MTTPRHLDWRRFLNKLLYCYGCGKFGVPRHGKPPHGWSLLYQPHELGPPGLLVCSVACKERVQTALQEGPVTQPLEVAESVVMPAEMQEEMRREIREFAEEKGHLRPMTERIISRDPKLRFGSMLAKYREDAGLSIEELCDKTEPTMAIPLYKAVEEGSMGLGVARIQAIAKVLNVHDSPLIDAAREWTNAAFSVTASSSSIQEVSQESREDALELALTKAADEMVFAANVLRESMVRLEAGARDARRLLRMRGVSVPEDDQTEVVICANTREHPIPKALVAGRDRIIKLESDPNLSFCSEDCAGSYLPP